jgi:hypothetical protein
MADPALQGKILASEKEFRPQYTALNLAEQEQYLRGVPGTEGKPGQAGAIDILKQITPDLVKAQEIADAAQRDADIRALQSQSGGYLSALMKANPQMFNQLEVAREMGGKTDFFGGLQDAIKNSIRYGDVAPTSAQAALLGEMPKVDLKGYQAREGTAVLQEKVTPVSLTGFEAAQGQATMAGAAPQAEASLLGAAPTMQASTLGAAPQATAQGYSATQASAPSLGAAPTVAAQGYQAAQAAIPLLGAAPMVAQQGYQAERGSAAMLGAAPTIASQGYTAQGFQGQQAAGVGGVSAQQLGQGALGQQLYGQAMQAGPTSASETFRQRAAQMATSTGQLSPEELRNAQQSTREAFAARGLEMSNQAIAAEAMSRADAVRQRQAQDIQQASALNQAYLADLGASRGFATGVLGQDVALQQANQQAGLQAALANQGVGTQLSLANQQAAQQAAQFGAAAQNEAALFGAGAANQAATNQAQLAAQFAQANQASQNQMAAANMAAGNQAAQFGATASNQAAMVNAERMAQFDLANQQAQLAAAGINVGALNQAGQFGASAQNAAAMANAQQAAQFALANQATQAQINLANAAALNQSGQFGAGAQNAVSLANADQMARFAMANQAAQMQAGQFNAQTEAQFAQANQAAQNQIALANQALLGQYGLSNQAASNQFGLANMQALQESRRFGAEASNQGQLANMQAFLQQAAANQAAQNQFGLANMSAVNQAAQFGAGLAAQGQLSNQDVAVRAAMANQAASNQFGLFNAEQATSTALQNRAFQAAQQQQNIGNLGLLGQAQQGELAANRAFQQNLVGMYGAAFDPMATVLGRPSGALGVGQQQQGMAAGMMAQMGGQVFSPDAGVNLALQNAANLGNYQAATFGARAGAQGARAAGIYQGIGNLLGCWVAREVYGDHNPMWLAFREWLYTKAPNWFVKLYEMYGERFAEWISDKPRIKNLIRKWMDSRIKSL